MAKGKGSSPGNRGKVGGGSFKPGIPQSGMAQQTVTKMASQPASKSQGTVATHGSSIANSGDGMSSTGHNVPRGYIPTTAQKGPTPLAHTGTNKAAKKKYNPASQVTGHWM